MLLKLSYFAFLQSFSKFYGLNEILHLLLYEIRVLTDQNELNRKYRDDIHIMYYTRFSEQILKPD